MNTDDSKYQAYVYAIREQLEQHLTALDELSGQMAKAPLSFIDRNSAERSLQVLVEVAIGCSKHFLKSQSKPVPSDARATVERVYELLAITDPSIQVMRGAIGMRNAIIHDYLNLDWGRVEPVLSHRDYHRVGQYVRFISQELLKVGAGGA